MSAIEDLLFTYVLPGFLICMVAFLALAALDGAQKVRSFDERVACEIQRMQPRRQILSARIVCVPTATRQDTTTVHVAPR